MSDATKLYLADVRAIRREMAEVERQLALYEARTEMRGEEVRFMFVSGALRRALEPLGCGGSIRLRATSERSEVITRYDDSAKRWHVRARSLIMGGAYTTRIRPCVPFSRNLLSRPLGPCGVSNHNGHRGGLGMPRKSTGKRLRFEVFKRDGFACVYCGAQPPEVVLVADHIDPVARGGASTIDNLNTACESCNQGKAHKPLGERAVRPDADLLYLEAQQEIAELRRYQEVEAAKRSVRREIIEGLQDRFVEVGSLDWHPSEFIIDQVLNRYGVTVTAEALSATAIALASRRVSGWYSGAGQAWVRYLWGCARNIAAREEGDN